MDLKRRGCIDTGGKRMAVSGVQLAQCFEGLCGRFAPRKDHLRKALPREAFGVDCEVGHEASGMGI